jgi:hypothetical protein
MRGAVAFFAADDRGLLFARAADFFAATFFLLDVVRVRDARAFFFGGIGFSSCSV